MTDNEFEAFKAAVLLVFIIGFAGFVVWDITHHPEHADDWARVGEALGDD